MGSFASYEARKPTVLTVPGLGGSGRSHWQSLWEEARPDTIRVELGMWSTPHRNAWVTRLDQAIRQAQAPVILAAHSLGCLAVAWWAELSPQPYGWPVAGALAPADVDRADAPEALKGFAPSPRTPLPFPRSSSPVKTIRGFRSTARTAWRSTGAAISSTPGIRGISMPPVVSAGGRKGRNCLAG